MGSSHFSWILKQMFQRIVAHKNRAPIVAFFPQQKEQAAFLAADFLFEVSIVVRIWESAFADKMIEMIPEDFEGIPSRLPQVRMELEKKGWRRQSQLMQAQAQTDKIKLRTIFYGIDDGAALGQVFEKMLLILGYGGFGNQPFNPALEEAARFIRYGITVWILMNGKFRSAFSPLPPPLHDSLNLRIQTFIPRTEKEENTLTEMLRETNFFYARLPV